MQLRLRTRPTRRCTLLMITWSCVAVVLLYLRANRDSNRPMMADISLSADLMNSYFHWPILDLVQRARIFPDGKQFVDMVLKHPLDEVIKDFQLRGLNNKSNKDDIAKFIEDNYLPAGSDVKAMVPSDWHPDAVNKLAESLAKEPGMSEWVHGIHKLWRSLARRPVQNAIPHLSSLIIPSGTDSNWFIVPGGRFREMFYWDTYWTMQGLAVSGMHLTMHSMLSTMLAFVAQLGYVPNCNRVYCLNRSQPPMLCLMVEAYLKATDDQAFLRENFHLLEREYDWWMSERTATVVIDFKYSYALNHYGTSGEVNKPRPESYREDFETASHSADVQRVYSELAAACESGQDFSSRWMAVPADLASVETSKMSINLTALCNGVLFDEAVSWNSPRPVFSDCFCKSVLALPSAVLLLLFIPYLVYLRSFPTNSVRWTRLFTAKVLVAALLAIAPFMDLLKAASKEASGDDPDAISYVSPSLLVAALIVCLVVHWVEQTRLLAASAFLFFFYVSSVLVSVPVLYNRVVRSIDAGEVLDTFGLATFASFLALLLTQLVLTCIYDIGLTPQDDVEDSPEASGTDRPPVFAECRSSIISRLTFSWLDRSVLKAYKKEIGEADVDRLDLSLRVRTVHGEFVRHFPPQVALPLGTSGDRRENPSFSDRVNSDTEQLFDEFSERSSDRVYRGRRGGRSLLSALWKSFGGQLILSWSIVMFHGLLEFANPLLLGRLIKFSEGEEELWHGVLYTILFFFVALISSLAFHNSCQISLMCGVKVRSALIAAIYRKSLSLTQEARSRSTVGEIVNLLTVDSNKIADAIPFLWVALVSPVQIALALTMLWMQLGVAVLAGIGVFVVIIPINAVIMIKSQNLEEREMKTKDERMKLLNEVINAMKVIKLYAWEPSFWQRINKIRQTEVGLLAKNSFLLVFVIVSWTVAPFLVMVIIFITYIYTGDDHVLTASKAFVSLTLFNILQFPISVLPWTITETVNAYVSLKRIQRYLNEDDIDESSVLRLSSCESQAAIEVIGASFSWKKDSTKSLLKDVDITVPKSKLVAIVGKVGSGKSSLLHSILGETVRIRGSVTLRGSVAYVPQEAWIQNLTVRENILFGRDFDQTRYNEALRVCQLEKDLQLLTAGDATEIGERGINLSGGQKQRVSLARAVYQDCDVYLLDDPLAAVDSHVGKKLFHEVIGSSGILKDKTRLLVTHGIHWLPHVDEIIVINEGRISEQGSYENLLDHDGPFASFLKEFFLQDVERKRAARSRDASVSPSRQVSMAAVGELEDDELAAERARILQRLASHGGGQAFDESLSVQAETHLSNSPPATELRGLSTSVGSYCSDASDRVESKRPPTLRQSSRSNCKPVQQRHGGG